METDTKFLHVFLTSYWKQGSAASSDKALTAWLEKQSGPDSVDESATDFLLFDGLGTTAVEGKAPVVPQTVIYPHAFDQGMSKGAAWAELTTALERLDKCSDAYDCGDIQEMATRMSEVALSLKAAYGKLDRNDPLAALAGFIRRASLAMPVEEISRAALEGLISVIRAMVATPVISLADAAELSDQLEEQGWRGDEPNIADLLQLIIGADIAEKAVDVQPALEG